jgi:hypothetical protein
LLSASHHRSHPGALLAFLPGLMQSIALLNHKKLRQTTITTSNQQQCHKHMLEKQEKKISCNFL